MNSEKRNSNISTLIETVLNYLLSSPFFGFDKTVLSNTNIAHLLLPCQDNNAEAKSKELCYLRFPIWYASQMFAHLAPLSQKRKPQAYGILVFAFMLSLKMFPQIFNEQQTRDAIQKQNYQIMVQQGYQPPIIPPSDPTQLHQFILNQYKKENNTVDQKAKQHLEEILKELNETDNSYNNESSETNVDDITSYEKAFSKINDMLSGKTKLSFVNALYAQEEAFGNTYLSYNDYSQNLKQSANFIKQWVVQQNAPLTADNLHYAIQQFMGDTISIKVLTDDKKGFKTVTHYPFKYDYQDYEGKKDYRNYFATKCLATGTGQCNSMPEVYLLLCEILGIKAYKTFAPMHSFIKYKNADGAIVNYEPTSHWNIPDKWYQEHMGVTNNARINGIYLDTLNKKQCVVNAMIDLAVNYMMKSNNPDSTFVLKCLNTSKKYSPTKSKNPYIYLAKSSLLIRQLHSALAKHGTYKLSEANNYPDTSKLYQRLQQNEEYLTSIGYEEMPKQLYEEMLQQQNNKTNSPDAKKVKSLFKTN